MTFFETLHDLADPVAALRAAAALLRAGGAVLIGDEKVAPTFTAPGDQLERFNYGWSALHCLPTALIEPTSIRTGTVIRPHIVRNFAREAGFSAFTVSPSNTTSGASTASTPDHRTSITPWPRQSQRSPGSPRR